MKKIVLVSVIFSFVAVFVFAMLFISERESYIDQMEHVGENELARCVNFASANEDSQELYEKITGVLDKYNANLYVTCEREANKKIVVTKYVYVNKYSLIDENICLVEGRTLNKSEKESDFYLSTDSSTQDKQKIGWIDNLSSDEIFEIRTLKSGLDSLVFSQPFVLQAASLSDTEKIINEWGTAGISATQLGSASHDTVDMRMVYVVVFVSLIVFLLMMSHDIMRSARNIAVKKMNGFSAMTIWKEKVLPLLVVFSIISVVVIVVGFFVLFKIWTPLIADFIVEITAVLIVVLVLAVAFLSLPFIYIYQAKVPDLLNNRYKTKAVVILNFCVKLVAMTIMTVFIVTIASRLQAVTGNTAVHQAVETANSVYFYTAIIVVMLLISVVILIQNIIGYVSENRYRIALQRTLGYGFLDKFSRYMLILGAVWLVILIVASLIQLSAMTFFICLGLFIFEMIMSFVILSIIEKRNLLQILKGG
jgi:hypothetical protein